MDTRHLVIWLIEASVWVNQAISGVGLGTLAFCLNHVIGRHPSYWRGALIALSIFGFVYTPTVVMLGWGGYDEVGEFAAGTAVGIASALVFGYWLATAAVKRGHLTIDPKDATL